MSRNLVWFILIVISALFLFVGGNNQPYFYPNDEICGMTEEKVGDTRTFVPWNVGIYIRRTLQSKYEYLVTGSISARTVVLSVFGGEFGYPVNASRKYFIFPPTHYLVVSGLPSNNLDDADEFTQFSNVSYVAPYTGHIPSARDYHLVIFRLKTPFNFTTPFVRPLCLPFPIIPFLRNIGFEGNKFAEVVTLKREPSFLGGFNAVTKGPYPLKFVETVLSSDDACFNTYKYHYRSKPDEIICVRVEPNSAIVQVDNSTCLTHGTMSVWTSSAFAVSYIPALGPVGRYFGLGPIGLIPRKDRGHCNVRTTYFIILVYQADTWIRNHMICKADTFPCTNGECIPLSQLCDGIPQCQDGEDEHVIFCSATNRCKKPSEFQCGFEGKCISISQVGDKVIDCPEGTDEDERLLTSPKFLLQSDNTKMDKCSLINISHGVKLKCHNNEFPHNRVNCLTEKSPVGTNAILTCHKSYTPVQRSSFMKMQCYQDKQWRPFRNFTCQRECGLLDDETAQSKFKEDSNSTLKFPWHASIFKKNVDGLFKFRCNGVLIEENIIVTSATCISNKFGDLEPKENFKIVLGSLHILDTKLSQIFQIEKSWWPPSFNVKTSNGNIAVVQLQLDGRVSVNNNSFIRPICYLIKSFQSPPQPKSTGKTPAFEMTQEGTILSSLHFTEAKVSTSNDCEGNRVSNFCADLTGDGHPPLCNVPSGSGFAVKYSKRSDSSFNYVLKGIASQEDTRCRQNKKTIFTHIDFYSEFILSVVETIDRRSEF